MYPKLFQIGSFYIPTYGVLVACGFLAGLLITLRLSERLGLAKNSVTDLAVYCAIAGIAGAKIFMFLFDFRYYLENPAQLFSFETIQAAGVFHGGFITALVVAVMFMRKRRMPVLTTMDAFAPGVAIGQALGRLGCFAAGCCWGTACYLPWGVRFRSDFAAPVPLDKPLHPVQLYESAANFVVFAILYRVFNRAHRPGTVIGLYLMLYSAVRFVVEFFREHEQGLVGPFSLTQWLAAGLFLLGAVMLIRGRQASQIEQADVEGVRA